jgi:hypothetical protein
MKLIDETKLACQKPENQFAKQQIINVEENTNG